MYNVYVILIAADNKLFGLDHCWKESIWIGYVVCTYISDAKIRMTKKT